MLLPLNNAEDAAAANYGWTVVAPFGFSSHGYCSSDPWITSITDSAQTELSVAGGIHPNNEGYTNGYAPAILAALQGQLYLDGTPVPPGNPQSTVGVSQAVAQAAGVLSANSTTITIYGNGFAPNENVDVTVHSQPVDLGDVTADGEGMVLATLSLPPGLPAGPHDVVLTGTSSGTVVSSSFVIETVTSVSPPADVPEAPAVPLLAVAGSLVAFVALRK